MGKSANGGASSGLAVSRPGGGKGGLSEGFISADLRHGKG